MSASHIQAPSVLIYSPSGYGKTVCAIRALRPDRTDWISTERGALKPAGNPDLNPHHPARPREEVCLHISARKDDSRVFTEFDEAIDRCLARVRSGATWNIVIDTLSSYARRLDHLVSTVIGVGREYGGAARAVGEHLMPYMDRIHESCATVRRPSGVYGATLVCLCHEKDPFQAAADKRTGAPAKSLAGGPDLPGALSKKIRHDFDLVLRLDLRYAGTRVERVFVHDSTDKMLPTKDRWGIVPDRGRGGSGIMPADLGAVLRAGAALDAGVVPRDEDLAVLHAYEGGGVNGAAVGDLMSL